jgi:hypothetical protein
MFKATVEVGDRDGDGKVDASATVSFLNVQILNESINLDVSTAIRWAVSVGDAIGRLFRR